MGISVKTDSDKKKLKTFYNMFKNICRLGRVKKKNRESPYKREIE